MPLLSNWFWPKSKEVYPEEMRDEEDGPEPDPFTRYEENEFEIIPHRDRLPIDTLLWCIGASPASAHHYTDFNCGHGEYTDHADGANSYVWSSWELHFHFNSSYTGQHIHVYRVWVLHNGTWTFHSRRQIVCEPRWQGFVRHPWPISSHWSYQY